MRLLKKLPAVEAKLQEGSLTLSHLSLIAPFAKHHELNLEQVSDLLESVENASTRQCQSNLAALAPETPKPDPSMPIGNELTEIRFTASRELMEKIERVKGLLGHQLKDLSYAPNRLVN